ncbi:MAG: ATP-binding protein [Solirubrobacterales bacterium]
MSVTAPELSETAGELRLAVPATSENVAVVRQAVAGLAEALDMGPDRVADLKTVVSEACMNAVVHAYPEAGGPVELVARPSADELEVAVRDFGRGIAPRPGDSSDDSLRLGLSLIAAMSDRFQIRGGAGRGTEITAVFSRAEAAVHSPEITPLVDAPETECAVLETTGDAMAQPMLGRIVSLLAARADLSVDRINDALLLSDALSARGAGEQADEPVRFEIGGDEDGLSFHVGPLAVGGAQRLIDGLSLPGIGGSLSVLADKVEVDDRGDAEFLALWIRGAAAGTASRDPEPA